MVEEGPDAERGDPVAELVEGDHPAGDGGRHRSARSSWPKLMVSGSSAEQPEPGQPERDDPGAGAPSGSAAMSTNVADQHERQEVVGPRGGSQRSIAAKSTRPTVTIAQNAVRATRRRVVEAPSSLVMSSCDQLPFIVSQMP